MLQQALLQRLKLTYPLRKVYNDRLKVTTGHLKLHQNENNYQFQVCNARFKISIVNVLLIIGPMGFCKVKV